MYFTSFELYIVENNFCYVYVINIVSSQFNRNWNWPFMVLFDFRFIILFVTMNFSKKKKFVDYPIFISTYSQISWYFISIEISIYGGIYTNRLQYDDFPWLHLCIYQLVKWHLKIVYCLFSFSLKWRWNFSLKRKSS